MRKMLFNNNLQKQKSMIIRAKKGTALENRLRELYERIEAERKRAFERAKEIFGAEPVCMTYSWGFGFSYMYSITKDVVFSAPLQNKPAHVVQVGEDRYRLSRRHKAAREFISKFQEDFRGIIPGLDEFGIHITNDLRYCSWQVIRELAGDFVFIAAEWCFPGDARDQYDIISESDVQIT